jgi:HEAT repeat protein
VSELGDLLDSLSGESEWERHRVLADLRSHGAPPSTTAALGEALASDDATQRAAARMALGALAHPGSPSREASERVLREALESDDPDRRILAASAMGESGNPQVADFLIRALDDPAANVAAAAAEALGELGVPSALEPLARLLQRDDFWVRAAAVVALGRIRDSRAIPALSRIAGVPALLKLLVEALRRIAHPDALAVLRRIHASEPRVTLGAAGAILSANPDLEPPRWVVQGARREEASFRYELVEHDDPAIARLLGVAATPEAVESLLDLAGPPRRSEAALSGLLAVPPDSLAPAIIERIPAADREEKVTLLSVLPPVGGASVQALLPLLEDDDAAVRASVADALGRAPVEEALPLLSAEAARVGRAPEVARALGGLGPQACQSLLPLLHDPSAAVRVEAANALARCADESAFDSVRAALADEGDPGVRPPLLRALGRAGRRRAITTLAEALDSTEPTIRLAAIEALGLSGAEEAVPVIRPALNGPTGERHAAIRALGDLGNPAAARTLEDCLGVEDTDLRHAVARAAVRLAPFLESDSVRTLATDPDPRVRVSAARVLAARGADGADRLRDMAESDPDDRVREEALRAARGDG